MYMPSENPTQNTRNIAAPIVRITHPLRSFTACGPESLGSRSTTEQPTPWRAVRSASLPPRGSHSLNRVFEERVKALFLGVVMRLDDAFGNVFQRPHRLAKLSTS